MKSLIPVVPDNWSLLAVFNLTPEIVKISPCLTPVGLKPEIIIGAVKTWNLVELWAVDAGLNR